MLRLEEIQRLIDDWSWKPGWAMRALRGRTLRLNGQAITDVDAIGERGGTPLLISAKGHLYTAQTSRILVSNAIEEKAEAGATATPPAPGCVVGCAMRMPGGDAAIVDRRKLTAYCLSPDHPRGKHKARVFASALGFTAENADELRVALLTAAATADAQPAGSDRFGDRYVIDSVMKGRRGAALVRTAWIVRRGESSPRLTSCFVK